MKAIKKDYLKLNKLKISLAKIKVYIVNNFL